jgi:hypothetical protein
MHPRRPYDQIDLGLAKRSSVSALLEPLDGHRVEFRFNV